MFETLDWLSDARQRWRDRHCPRPEFFNPSIPETHRTGSVWVFVSTIGELNLSATLLDRIGELLPESPLTLLTDRPIYRDSYLAKYPSAYVHYLPQSGHSSAVKALMRETPPQLLLIVEIPCVPSDGPCRLPYTVLHPLKCANVPTALINGWLYGYTPASSLDRLERSWFQQAYLDAMDLITVQSDGIQERMLRMGASARRLHVTGNLKFDALGMDAQWTPAGKRSTRLLRSIQDGLRPVIVAGCVTDDVDQELVVSAFAQLRCQWPDAALVIAPRHPEKRDRMQALAERLARHNLLAVYRSQHGDQPVPPGHQCLVLDTFGELKDFYAVGTSTFVGRDHNLLEPLSFAKPVLTTTGWEASYPSYPVFEQLVAMSAVRVIDDAKSLSQAWSADLSAVRGRGDEISADIREQLVRMGGATTRNLELLATILAAHRAAPSRALAPPTG